MTGQRPDWWLDEYTRAGEEHLDPDYVASYDQKAGFDPSEDVALFRSLGLDPGSTVVDFGAGTGTFALSIAPYCGRVVAVDISPAMLKTLQTNARMAGRDNIEVVRAGLLSYEHIGEPADFIYSRNALHHLSDFWKALALRRMVGIMRPGGVLRLHDLIFSCDIDEIESIVEEWLEGAAPTPDVGWTRAELATHLTTEFSTYSWLLEPMLEQAGLEIQDVNSRPRRPYAAYTCVKRS